MKDQLQSTPTPRLSRKQLCALFQISKNTLKRREAEGMINPIGPNARVLRYGAADVGALVNAGYDPDPVVAAELGLDLSHLGIRASGESASEGNGVPRPIVSETPFLNSAPNQPAPAAFLVKLAAALQKPHIRQAILALVDAAA